MYVPLIDLHDFVGLIEGLVLQGHGEISLLASDGLCGQAINSLQCSGTRGLWENYKTEQAKNPGKLRSRLHCYNCYYVSVVVILLLKLF